MTTVIYLIRHGAPEILYDNQGRSLIYGPDAHLSPEGKRQVTFLADKIQAYDPLDVIYTSDYARAFETAMIIADHFGIGASQFITDKRLVDTKASGWIGVPWEELLRLGNGGFFRDPRTEENPNQIEARMWNTFKDISEKEKGKRIGIVSHRDPLRILYWRIKNPQGGLPSIEILTEQFNLGTSEAYRIIFDKSGVFSESILLSHK